MVFQQENLSLQLLDVLAFSEGAGVWRTKARSFCALSLRLEGDADIILKSETVHLKGGDLAFFPANTAYTRRARYDRMIVFHFYIQNYVQYELEVSRDIPLAPMKAIFQAALAEWTEKKPGCRYRATALLYQAFGEILAQEKPPARPRSACVEEALNYFSLHYPEPDVTIRGLTDFLHLSETYFRRVFLREMGTSPKKYLSDLRLERAQALLNTGYETVAAVAEKVGYRDAKNFSTAFKKRLGYPPAQQEYQW